MKKLYLIILLFTSFTFYGQEVGSTQSVDLNNPPESQVLIEGEIEGFRMFPNPVTSGTLNIYTRNNRSKTVIIYDILGKQVYNRIISATSIDVSNIAKGVYILRVTEGENTSSRKLVIQ